MAVIAGSRRAALAHFEIISPSLTDAMLKFLNAHNRIKVELKERELSVIIQEISMLNADTIPVPDGLTGKQYVAMISDIHDWAASLNPNTRSQEEDEIRAINKTVSALSEYFRVVTPVEGEEAGDKMASCQRVTNTMLAMTNALKA
jgi:hypothetical protein